MTQTSSDGVLMVRRRLFGAVSNHDDVRGHPSRRAQERAPLDEDLSAWLSVNPLAQKPCRSSM
jgi:hypothetical protein